MAPPALPAAATKPGLRQIGKGDQIRQVHPVDVADWLALGWQVLPADELPGCSGLMDGLRSIKPSNPAKRKAANTPRQGSTGL
jgi:hypothetical protein